MEDHGASSFIRKSQRLAYAARPMICHPSSTAEGQSVYLFAEENDLFSAAMRGCINIAIDALLDNADSKRLDSNTDLPVFKPVFCAVRTYRSSLGAP